MESIESSIEGFQLLSQGIAKLLFGFLPFSDQESIGHTNSIQLGYA